MRLVGMSTITRGRRRRRLPDERHGPQRASGIGLRNSPKLCEARVGGSGAGSSRGTAKSPGISLSPMYY